MKIRLGFVSNSSSSSFICDVCGEECGGMDIGLSDCEMFECMSGHTICDSHQLEPDTTVLLAEIFEDARENSWLMKKKEEIEECAAKGGSVYEILDLAGEGRYETPTCLCPVCNLHKVLPVDAYNYLLMLVGRTQEDVAEEIKEKFDTLGAMYTVIRAHKEKADETS